VGESDSVREAYIAEQDLDQLLDDAAAALWQYLACPCPRCAFWLGVQAGGIVGFSPAYVAEAAAQILRDRFTDDDAELPPGGDLLAVNDAAQLWAGR
jgi:hypothetical protein